MRRISFCCSASVLVAALACTCGAATVLTRQILHEIRDDGTVMASEVVSVRIDSDADVDRWSSYSVYLDDHIELERLAGSAKKPDGETVVIDKRKMHDIAYASEGSLHSSSRLHVAAFEETLPVGTIVSYERRTITRPYFNSGVVSLYDSDGAGKLRVEVRGAGEALVWTIEGPRERLEVEEGPGNVVVRADGIAPFDEPDAAPDDALFPRLRYDWTGAHDWKTVGDWYDALVSEVARNDPAVKAHAKATIEGAESEWDKLGRLVRFAQSDIRYVAVEVGVGGYKPSPPAETFTRRWGDCKDKVLLLIEMLEEAGIAAHPALIQSSLDGRVDPEFPTNLGFNHLIVAVEERPWMPQHTGARAGGYLFVDPTQTTGLAEWLGPQTQDKYALVIRGGASELVLTPTNGGDERRELVADLEVSSDGFGNGRASYTITGALASAYLHKTQTEEPDRIREDILDLFDDLFPGAAVHNPSWEPVPQAVPRIVFRANVAIGNMVSGDAERRSLRISAPTGFPDSRLLKERSVPVVLRPREIDAEWNVRLPSGWCPAVSREEQAANELGSFSHHVAQNGDTVEIRRRSDVARRRVAISEIEALRELSLAEHRSLRRRVRLRCED